MTEEGGLVPAVVRVSGGRRCEVGQQPFSTDWSALFSVESTVMP
ncbi:hypothetical protein JOF59_004005 [Streptomyces clavifer]|uniref:Uncharacterized protein n=1 Tax=Streptomyces clavifer TaxID=68188 RepID=A0ABS4VCG4_9ACTN|nr:hypothetical protein [Streptomyces clavifer]